MLCYVEDLDREQSFNNKIINNNTIGEIYCVLSRFLNYLHTAYTY